MLSKNICCVKNIYVLKNIFVVYKKYMLGKISIVGYKLFPQQSCLNVSCVQRCCMDTSNHCNSLRISK